MSGMGHNSGAEDDTFAVSEADLAQGNDAAEELRQLIERVERLEEEKKGIADDIKDVFAEAKSRGYDTKALKRIIALRKKSKEDREAEDAVLETYLAALGMI